MPPKPPRNTRPVASSDGKLTQATTLDDELLMMFEDGLRARLPGVEEITARANTRKRNRKIAASSVAMLAICGLLWLDPVYYNEHIVSAVGERHTLTLHDGSEIALNTDSSLRVAHHLRSRHFYLEQGEASFTASHPRLRNFVVHANRTRVVDIGTIFNVRNTQQGAAVTVLEGSVEVSADTDGAHKQVLHAGQTLETGLAGAGLPHTVDAELATGWRHGKLYFDRTPLRDMAAELRRYRAQPIEVAPSLESLRISGQFDIDNIERLLDQLPTLAPVAIQHHADGRTQIVPKADDLK
ncbi:hypothetical protein GCM10007205_18000 [Oxalicibacterium flavum]|uniref:FecR protein domain-containing protein n=1 Tax=Oxalicibacterium flavum TaxID=179467 RepID=A0A8J2UMU3_9BURK|nr:FecR domain-containing protein [Oxalicibacterium flavum]GGC09247.1 hypothetical protein GCM10007205_18000 [Oxalicibacterium flavum]